MSSPLLTCSRRVSILLGLVAVAGAQELAVTAQGRLFFEQPRELRVSPEGGQQLRVRALTGDCHDLSVLLDVMGADGEERTFGPLSGNGFLATDAGRVVVTTSRHGGLRRLVVLDADGAELFVREGASLSGATLSSDGRHVAWRSVKGVEVLDLASLSTTLHPELRAFVPIGGGGVVGVDPADERVVVVRSRTGEITRNRLPAAVREVGVDPAGRAVFALTARSLWRIDLVSLMVSQAHVLAPGDGEELVDLLVWRDGVHVGLRRAAGRTSVGSRMQFGVGGNLQGSTQGASAAPPRTQILPVPVGSLPWPLFTTTQRAVGNTYAEYQNYGGSPYMHPGVDVMGDDGEPVFAVDGGVVKAILTTSGQYHWRVAIGEPGGGTSTGYLYAHLDLPTIAVSVGDVILPGQYLGDLVPWPVASFTHVHFSRIEDTGTTWSGDWLCTDDTHDEFWPQSETEAPVFEKTIGPDLFAFCKNESSFYLDPDDLSGRVDIIVHVGDRITSSWVCSVHELRYSIWPEGAPGSPVVEDKLAVHFDMMLDTYADGPFDPFLVDLLYKEDSTCDTDGDYSSREFFHVITNSDGDDTYESSDADEAWDTTLVPDGDYVIEVTALDHAGNVATASMTVTVAN